MSDTDLLRRAARRLRETSGDADTWTWLTATAKAVTAIADRDPSVHQSHHGRAPELAVSDHLAVFSPLVGTTLADWLDLTAERVEKQQWRDDGPMVARALAVARAITLEDLTDALTKES